jgi:predicted transcriptional regulator YheO
VGRGIQFSVTPLYPKSFEITAGGSRLRDAEELKAAWQKKATLVANGRHFKSSSLVVRDNESDYGGGLVLSRSVTGTITLTD